MLAPLVAAAFQVPSHEAVATGPSTPRATAPAAVETTEPAPGPAPDQGADPGPRPARPNILLITTDDQSVADLAHMPMTRRLLADKGATFTDAISSFPLCCPARATILTGQLSHNHGVRTNKAPNGGYQALARQQRLNRSTVGTWLQQQGYRTMFTGKYLNGYGNGDTGTRVPPGWDDWYATSGGTYSYSDFEINENGKSRTYRDAYQTDVFGRYTNRHIRQSVDDNRPFFIWESNLAPHNACRPRPHRTCAWGPPQPADRDRSRFSRLRLGAASDPSFNERVVSEKPSHMRALRSWGAHRRARTVTKHRMRVRSLQAVDRSVARTVGVLRDQQVLDNTLIIFTSDNGYLLGQHRWAGKILPYEPSLRVPLLMRWTKPQSEGGIPAGVTRSQTSALVDLPATIADAAGVPIDQERQVDVNGYKVRLDGRSLLPIARGEADAPGYGAMSIESGQQGWNTSDRRWFYRGVRTGRYTYVSYPRKDEVELYDRREDPHQLNNVAYRPAYRRTRAALADKLTLLRDCEGLACLDVSGVVPDPRPEPHLRDGQTVHPDELGSIGRSRQVVTLTARSWSTGRGWATAWQRRGRTWTVRRGPFRVLLGGRGLAPAAGRRAGSGKTPAGSFEPAFALGHLRNPGTSLPYRRLDPNDYWVMDRRVPETYNVYQERRSAKATWRRSAAERWWANRGHYPHALVLDYNLPRGVTTTESGGQSYATAPADVRKGSLVLHTGGRRSDRGWASMDRDQMRWLLRWIHPLTRGTTFVVGTPRHMRSRL